MRPLGRSISPLEPSREKPQRSRKPPSLPGSYPSLRLGPLRGMPRRNKTSLPYPAAHPTAGARVSGPPGDLVHPPFRLVAVHPSQHTHFAGRSRSARPSVATPGSPPWRDPKNRSPPAAKRRSFLTLGPLCGTRQRTRPPKPTLTAPPKASSPRLGPPAPPARHPTPRRSSWAGAGPPDTARYPTALPSAAAHLAP